ncbi:unnamed protein product [Cochlearia groenlandica]
MIGGNRGLWFGINDFLEGINSEEEEVEAQRDALRNGELWDAINDIPLFDQVNNFAPLQYPRFVGEILADNNEEEEEHIQILEEGGAAAEDEAETKDEVEIEDEAETEDEDEAETEDEDEAETEDEDEAEAQGEEEEVPALRMSNRLRTPSRKFLESLSSRD